MTACLWPAAAVGAVLALDETALAQTWLSQPLPAGWLAGLAAGDPVTGLVLGAAVQLLVMGDLPIGETTLREHVGPLVGTVFAATALGWRLDLPWRDPAGAGHLGWLLAGVAAASLAGRVVVKAERDGHARWQAAALQALRAGRDVPVGWYHLGGLALTALRGGVMAVGWCLVMTAGWLPLWERAGALPRQAAGLLVWWAPAVGAGALLDLYGTRQGRPYLALGAALALLVWGLAR